MLYKFSYRSKIDYKWICPGILVTSTGFIIYGKRQWWSQICLAYMKNGLRLSFKTNSYWYAVCLPCHVHYEIEMSVFVWSTLTPNTISCFLIRNTQFSKTKLYMPFTYITKHLLPQIQENWRIGISENVGQRSRSQKMTLKGQMSQKVVK